MSRPAEAGLPPVPVGAEEPAAPVWLEEITPRQIVAELD